MIKILGTPQDPMRFAHQNEEVWDYLYSGTLAPRRFYCAQRWAGALHLALYTLHFTIRRELL